MNQNTVSGNLDRIKRATDDMRLITGTTGEDIETVAQAVSNLNDDNIAKDETIAELEQEIEDLQPSGTININNNGVTNVAGYQYANVNVSVSPLFVPKSFVFTDGYGMGMEQIDATDLPSLKLGGVESFIQAAQYYDMSHLTKMFFGGLEIPANKIEAFCDAFNNANIGVSSCYDMFRGAIFDGGNLILHFNSSTTQPQAMDTMFMSEEGMSGGPDFIKIDGINTQSLMGLYAVFRGLYNVQEIWLPELNFITDTSKWYLRQIGEMFSGDTSLQMIYMPNFQFHLASQWDQMLEGVPTDCVIVVKDATEKTWFATNFAEYTNVQTIEEYEGGNE